MHNDFVIIGPAGDHAGIGGMSSAAAALKKIADSRSPFISRGDDSGTHKKEKELWEAAGLLPRGSWYMEVGQGMGAVITISNDMQAYTIADRGTYLALKDKIQLGVLVEGDPALFNPYGIIAVNPGRHAHVNYSGALQFITWITSVEAQEIILNFKKRGQILFYPDAIK
ncbi:Tungstate-binding protein TupA [subsurface metagenome]